MNRDEILNRVRSRETPWDFIVIGGGATGVGCALDAAARGFDVLLLEQHDFGKGTSSRSTKLIHGGVRYLRHGNISLVRESLKERGILLKNAPHVVHKQAFIVPCYSLWQKFFYGTGLKIYDLLSGKYTFGRSRIISKTETVAHLPTLKSEGLSGGILYVDGQFDDTRLLIDLVKTAHKYGGAVLNYTKVDAFTRDAEGRINGVVFTDVETDECFTVSAKAIINATGTFCDSVREMADAESEPIVTHSQGIHLVFDRKFLPSDIALLIPKTSDGRVLFCIPWHGHLLVGTTETSVEYAEVEPKALESEIDFILETAGKYMIEKPARKDILSVFAGIRPLVKSGKTKNTASLSRGHTIEIDKSGLLTITGGKWTTYRRMAEDAVDKAIEIGGFEPRPSITAELAIDSSNGFLDSPTTRLHANLSHTREEVLRAVRFEMARTVEDVLARRTRALFTNANAALELVPIVADIVAAELEKDEKWIEDQLSEFRKLAQNYLTP